MIFSATVIQMTAQELNELVGRVVEAERLLRELVTGCREAMGDAAGYPALGAAFRAAEEHVERFDAGAGKAA